MIFGIKKNLEMMGSAEKSSYKRIAIIATFGILLFTYFATQSRYPDLNRKAGMGVGGHVELQALGFDEVVKINKTDSYLKRVYSTFINWSYTNKKGMTFGVFFAAAFLTFLSFVSLGRSKSRFINALKGVFIGTPMGVCANCATPIGQGMNSSGEKPETVLATVISSPTLNVVVLSMLFSLFPFQIALLKVLFTLFLLFIIVPFISKIGQKNGPDEEICAVGQVAPIRIKESWTSAFKEVSKIYFKKLIYIFFTTVPLMALAGLLGSVVIESISPEFLMNIEANTKTILAVGLIGTFLPVPIAFDVIIVNTLLSAGLHPILSMTLLFTLGTFSIYFFFIIWSYMSRRLAVTVFVTVMILGLTYGLSANKIKENREKNIISIFEKNSEIISDSPKVQTFIYQVESECELLKDKDTKESCIKSGVLNITKVLGTEKTCSKFSSSESQLICKDIERSNLAIKDGNIKNCENILDKYRKFICVKYSIQKSLVRGVIKDIDYCDNYTEIRRDRCIKSFALYFNEPKYCERSSKSQIISCKNSFFNINQNDGLARLSEEKCEKIKVQKVKTDCQNRLLKVKLNENLDLNICNTIKNNDLRSRCKIVAIKKLAPKLNNKKLCDKLLDIPDKKEFQNCIDNVNLLQIAQNGVKGCEKISSKQSKVFCASVAIYKVILGRIAQDNFKYERIDSGGRPDEFVTVSSEYAGNLTGIELNKYSEELTEIEPGVIVAKLIKHSKKDITPKFGFLRKNASELGIENYHKFSPLDFYEPFKIGRGIASGDINLDKWPDIVLGGRGGVYLYVNRDGKYTRVPVTNSRLKDLDILSVALIDQNNDNFDDIYYSSYGGENGFIINNKGSFKNARIVELPKSDRVYASATSFGDYNRDGRLDVVLGNWTFGGTQGFKATFSKNELFLASENLKFVYQEYDNIRGETLSVLASDINHDGYLDLLTANDWTAPDSVFVTNHLGIWNKIDSESKIFPITSKYNMSYASADINNDLLLDVFSVDMSFKQSKDIDYCAFNSSQEDNIYCEKMYKVFNQIKNGEIEKCAELEKSNFQNSCYVSHIINLASQLKREDLCGKIPNGYKNQKNYCRLMSKNIQETEKPSSHKTLEIPQTNTNVMLVQGNDGKFRNHAYKMGLNKSYWSWNANFADLDNDQWQDIYIANGFMPGDIHSNIFFHNQKGVKFIAKEREFGLENKFHTSSYTYLDINMDGALDIISTGIMSPPQVFINRSRNNSIGFFFKDEIGNSKGIGNKVYITYGNGKRQMREIILSGGYISYNAPMAHFGLENFSHIDNLEIHWSTGHISKIDTKFEAGHYYQINRLKDAYKGKLVASKSK